MEYTEFEALFAQALDQNGIEPLLKETVERFFRFTEHLLTVNSHTNLTAIRTIPEIIAKHYVDSLLVSELLPKGARVLDLGCGPGFPSIPLTIARPDLSIFALDSTEKKIRFVKESAALLGLDNLSAHVGRAEDRKTMDLLGKFDVVVSRAVARLNVLCELCLPYAAVGGQLIAMKAAKADEELFEAQNAIKILGGVNATLNSRELTLLSGETEPRALILIPKTKETPTIYPRIYATIQKKPL